MRPRRLMTLAAGALLAALPKASAAVLRLAAYDGEGRSLSARELLDHIAPRSRKGTTDPAASGVLVTDLDGNPVSGRPWWVPDSTEPALSWSDAARVKISLPWPIADDGFSTVLLDKGGAGYADGDLVHLSEEIALTQSRLFRESLNERMTSWEPAYQPGPKALKLQRLAQEALDRARAAADPRQRAVLYERALTALSLAWAKALYEHGAQTARHPRIGPSLRWGLTLDETLLDRLDEYDRIVKMLGKSGANWVRLVFRLNAEDFAYASPRSWIPYDKVVSDLAERKIHVMASVLDSSQWPRNLTPEALESRTRNLVMRFKDRVRSWEVASEPNGTCLGGCRTPLPDETVFRAFTAAAAEVKRIDPSLETVATLYWWEGTAGDDAHPTFAWLKRAIPRGAFAQIDLVALSVYPDDNPMGLAFDPVFRRLGQYFPTKRLMLGAYGYVPGRELEGYWWLDPQDAESARNDLVILYTGAACAIPRTAGGGFWWDALSQMFKPAGRREGLLRTYQRTVKELRR